MTTVTLSLISHTNVGKTTLARTLLRRDIGEVLDQAHVTEVSEAHPLIEADGDVLSLWDTPGLGDTTRLLKRLRSERNPLGWFLHQVWDRTTDRPLWCSQEALRNVRDDSDVVLYLVNASEAPEEAGYVPQELEILSWMGRPVLALLNQTGPPGERQDALRDEWREALRSSPAVRDTLALDAFTRCWVHEDRLFERIVALLDGEKAQAMTRLANAWRARNLDVFRSSLRRVADHVASTACDREPLAETASRSEKEQAMSALSQRLERSSKEVWDEVIAAHGLEGGLAEEARKELDDFRITEQAFPTPKKSAMIGGAFSGAVSGLMADLLAGGFTFGGGLLAGTILGALGGAGLSRAVTWAKGDGERKVTWSKDLLDLLVRQSVLRYLSVAHFGRGRGELREAEAAAPWTNALDELWADHEPHLASLWKRAAESGAAARRGLASDLERELDSLTREILRRLYPDARALT